MGVKWKTEKDYFPKVKATVQTLNGRKVKIGALQGQNAYLASIHEYG